MFYSYNNFIYIKIMKQKRKDYLVKKLNLKLDEENRAILNIKISDDSNFLSPFYYDKPIISDELGDFILKHRTILLWKDGVSIHLISNNISDDKKEIYPDAIRSYFEQLLVSGKRRQKRNYVLSIILFLIGVIIFSLLFILDYLIGDSLGMWSEVIDVIAWVFIWEAVDISIIERLENTSNVIIAKNLVNSKIVFINEDINT